MAEIKWIKIVTDVFDDEKILMIETMPDADSLIVIWFKLLCLAGKQNNSGVFLLGRMPYTDEMFSTIFRRPLNTVRLALKTFEQFGMIEIVNNTVTIPNWGKHQSIDQIEAKNEYMRNYMKEYRAKQKLISEGRKTNSKTNSKTNVSLVDKSRKEKEQIRAEADVEGEETPQFLSEQEQLQQLGGTLGKGVVFLSERQSADLMDRIGFDAYNHYVEKLADFIINKKAYVKSHYDTILKWVAEDSRVTGG